MCMERTARGQRKFSARAEEIRGMTKSEEEILRAMKEREEAKN